MGQVRDGGIVEESLGPMHFRKQERKVRTPGLTQAECFLIYTLFTENSLLINNVVTQGPSITTLDLSQKAEKHRTLG